MKISFTEHPRSIGETYLEHMIEAWNIGFHIFKFSCCVFIHSIFPFLFVTTASDGILNMAKFLKDRREGKHKTSRLRFKDYK